MVYILDRGGVELTSSNYHHCPEPGNIIEGTGGEANKGYLGKKEELCKYIFPRFNSNEISIDI